jgi:DNA-binding MarR family transcriptional regulator
MNVKRYVDELEQRALIRSGNLTTDRRPRTLFLTEVGEIVARDVGRLVETQQHWLVGSMSQEEGRNFEVGLEWLEARLGIGAVERPEVPRRDSPAGTSASSRR